MTDTSQQHERNGTGAVNRRIRSVGTIAGIGVLVAVAGHLVWRNFGSDEFARTTELGGLFLYWWAFGSVIGVASFVFALKSTKPAPLLDFVGVFVIASTVGAAVAASDFSAGRLGPVTLTVPLLFPCIHFLILQLRTSVGHEGRTRRSVNASLEEPK